MDLVGGRGLPRWLRFIKFVCQNERTGSLSGGGGAPGASPLNPPMVMLKSTEPMGKHTIGQLHRITIKQNV